MRIHASLRATLLAPSNRWIRSSSRPRAVSLLLGIAIVATIAGCAPGMKLLRLEIHREDQPVLRTQFDAPDRLGGRELWPRAGRPPFSVDTEVVRVTPDDDDPLRATLQGAIRLEIRHGRTIETRAELTDLTLVRESAESPTWFLPPEEIERAMRAGTP